MTDHPTLPPPAHVPFSGVSMFYASGDMVQAASERARSTVAAGARTAFLLIESVEGTRRHPDVVQEHVVAVRERGIEPILFMFPTSDRIKSALDHLERCGELAGVWKVILDIEPWRDAKGVLHDWTEAQVRELVDGARALGFEVIITLFSRPAWHHIRWGLIAAGVTIVLQVYDRVRDPEMLAAAVAAFPDNPVVIAIGTYVGDVHRLDGDLANAAPYAEKAGALAVWDLKTTSSAEADRLRDFAGKHFARAA